MANYRNSERSEDKVARVPVGGPQLKLQMSDQDRKGFVQRKMVPHWLNDDPGRLERAEAGGYKFVDPVHVPSLGRSAVHADASDPESGARVSMVVSRGDPIQRAYLMEIKEEFYKEDQIKKEAVNAQVDEALALGGSRGSEVESEYRP